MRTLAGLTAAAMLALAAPAGAQTTPPTAAHATDALSFLDGRWEGEGWNIDRQTRQREAFRHVERVGPRLDGGVRLLEGRAFGPDGKLVFNALGVVSARAGGGYELRAYSPEGGGAFEAAVRGPGVLEWVIPAGPGRVVYVITVKDGVWEETGHFTGPDNQPRQFFFMRLERTGEASWAGPDG
jgi:hypothetical protein